jgi:hypothetical protein
MSVAKASNDLAPSGSNGDLPCPTVTLECQAGLQALNAAEDEDEDEDEPVPSGSLVQTTLDVDRDGVDIRLPFFRDLLADTPVPGADAIRSLADWSGVTVVDGQSRGGAAGKKAWDGQAGKLVF